MLACCDDGVLLHRAANLASNEKANIFFFSDFYSPIALAALAAAAALDTTPARAPAQTDIA